MLVTRIFFFSQIVFYSINDKSSDEQICRLQMISTLSQTSPGLQYKSFENAVEKEEIARNEQFLLFPQCFLPILRTFYHFHQILNLFCTLFWKPKSLFNVVFLCVSEIINTYNAELICFKCF